MWWFSNVKLPQRPRYQSAWTSAKKAPEGVEPPEGFEAAGPWRRFHFDGNGYDWRRELRREVCDVE